MKTTVFTKTHKKSLDETFIPPKGNVKIKYWDTSLEQIKDLQIAIRKKYPKLKDVVTERQDNISIGQDRENKLDIGDVRDTNYQNELIEDFLKRNVEGLDNGAVKRVQKIISKFDSNLSVIVLKNTAKTAKDAANSLNCEVGAIVKSLLFKVEESFLICF